MGNAVPEQRRRNILSLIPKPEGSMWSDDQWKAISETGDHILVAAAAGSGKTAVLVERIIRKIIDTDQGFSVDRLLVATFTKAAAAEMRDRIREALDKELEKDPENVHLRRQLSLLGRASITTLHSFCLEVIRRYYQMIPMDPNFRIINENEAELLRQEILEELFEEKYGMEGEGSDFIRLVDWFSGERTDDAMHLLVQKLYDFSRSHAWPDRWLRDTADAFAVQDTESLGRTAWVQSILQDARLALAGAEGLLKQAHGLAMAPGGPGAYADNLNADLEMIRMLQDAMEHRSWEELYDIFQGISFGKLKSVRKDETDPQLQERVKELRDSVKKTAADLRGALFGRSAETFLAELNEAAPLMKELAELVIEFGERYDVEKRKRGAVDFSDLEHYCLRILLHGDSTPDHPMPSDAAMEYREQFDEVLLDEYQDTNSVQETIVNLISRDMPGNRFMVGDVKQSIYRFRLAEPGLFLDKYRRYDSGSSGIRIDLARNFRSRMEVVDAVNVIFRQIMNETVAEVSYDQRAELVYGASFPNAGDEEEAISSNPYEPELLLIDRAGKGSSAEEETQDGEGEGLLQESEILEMETAQLEARAIAKKIRNMLGDTSAKPLLVYDKGLKEMRPVQYGDMVILLRSAYIWGPLIMEELKQLGIPADGEQSRGYFQATEVEIMLSLLQIIDNPQQDIPLAGVLRSPIVGLTEEELAQIRLVQSGSFYDALIASVKGGRDGENEALQELGQAIAEAAPALEMTFPAQEVEEQGLHDSTAVPDPVTGNVLSPELTYKINDFVKRLLSWRDISRQESLGDLIWRVYRETGYLDWVGGLPGGAERQNNLKALYDRAVQFEQTTASRGLFRFLTFVSRLRDRGGDLGGGGSTEHKDNAVRIMTIHKSKGLEFPVVFLAGMSKTFNQQDLNASFLMHKELGFGPKFVDEEKRVSFPTLPNLAIRRRSQLELLAEEMRVLYVGLTRPKEKLFLIATVKDLGKKVSSWAQVQEEPEYMLPDYILAKGRSYIDWVGPALIRHPGAAKLREMMDLGTAVSPVLAMDSSVWKISVQPADELTLAALGGWEEEEESTPERKNRLQAIMNRQSVDPEVMENGNGLLDEPAIGFRLNWQYPYETATKLAAKTSVSEMKKLLSLQDQPSENWVENEQLRRDMEEPARNLSFTLPLQRPKFMEQNALTPTERGTVYHTLMQHIPLGQGHVNAAVVEETVQRLVERELLTREQAEIIRPEEVGMFFGTEIGERLQAAEWTTREMPFSYGLTAEEAHNGLFSNTAGLLENPDFFEMSVLSEETVLIQGVVDCLFRQDGRLVLLDYKTDRVLEHRGGISTLAEQYRFQLHLYAKALEDILHEEISEKWLYFFDGGHAVRL
ncbi:helicase-exonuclease AddAB subunit AddA [Paenibacillus sp. HJL G12]|uniref:ATP-dependent helicase/nuclease subunit A n=1 Tax=Paenibacillus dendrobii TaxID=2691084 RepID=A0A7X3IJW8_9BACL|nr:helicase-exonuclease AddAB subunit AddA [Paenibacillus dendrobii]MWV45294.1 helicase-exonuclease AddAB subunit AddA [Paenibacillus dendrobii]